MQGSPNAGKPFLLLAAVLLLVTALPAQVSVVTQSNNPARTGWNNQETILNTSNVNMSNFGKLFALNVDGYIYAQPLYVSNVSINGKTHNVIYVATENNSVYAFDADSLGPALWQVSVNGAGTPVNSNDICAASGQADYCADLIPEVGITATPVIDPSTNTMYVVAETKDSSYHFKLHALDITSGAERPGSPVEIDGSDQTPPLNQLIQLNRPGLLLLNGKVYTAFGSNGDFAVNSVYWHGWIFAYDATTLQRKAVFDVSPNNGYLAAGGIWQGGKGLVSDVDVTSPSTASIYVATSNGSFNNTGSDYASSFLKLDQSLTVKDYFAPGAHNEQSYLNTSPGNVDIGAGGPILLPTSPPEIVGGGKDGILRVVNTTNMGGYNTSVDQNVQTFQATNAYPNGMIFGGPVLWTNQQNVPVLYLWGPGDVIKGWKLAGTTFQTTPVTQGTIQNQASEDTLAALSISSNGSQAGSGIVWASRFLSLPPSGTNSKVAPGVLTAFDADNLANELWDSQQNSGRDAVNEYAKFVPPTVANGKVYLPTWVGPNVLGQNSGQLLVYGLLNSVKQVFSLSGSPSAVTVSPGQSAKYTITINSNGFNGAVNLACSALPAGANCQFASNPTNAGASTTLTITTQAPSTALLRPIPEKRSLLPLYGVLLPPFGLALAGVGLGSRRRKLMLALFAVLLLCLILAACGGGGSSTGGGGGGGGGGGTPAGSYSVIVTGTPSSGSQQFTTITLTVQ